MAQRSPSLARVAIGTVGAPRVGGRACPVAPPQSMVRAAVVDVLEASLSPDGGLALKAESSVFQDTVVKATALAVAATP